MKFYRYDIQYSEVHLDVIVSTFKLVKETPCGYWICQDTYYFSLEKRWISKTSRKRYAYPTKKEALNSFIIRKQRQIKHCTRDLGNAKQALNIAKQIKL